MITGILQQTCRRAACLTLVGLPEPFLAIPDRIGSEGEGERP